MTFNSAIEDTLVSFSALASFTIFHPFLPALSPLPLPFSPKIRGSKIKINGQNPELQTQYTSFHFLFSPLFFYFITSVFTKIPQQFTFLWYQSFKNSELSIPSSDFYQKINNSFRFWTLGCHNRWEFGSWSSNCDSTWNATF